MIMNYKEAYQNYLQQFESVLQAYCVSEPKLCEKLSNAMQYSLTAGGKRLRPVIAIATCQAFGGDINRILSGALALEMVHTYSLIHDDLPSMDNDDFRRGKPTNHKVFGEATAILAGDALLNNAYEILFATNNLLQGKILSSAAGHLGMVGGQSLDLESEGKEISPEKLNLIHTNKTGKLLSAAFLMGEAAAKGYTTRKVARLGQTVGMLFQITDDLLDVTGTFENLGKSIGKDSESCKLTAVRVYGLENAKKLTRELESVARELLVECGLNTPFFTDLITEITKRVK